MAHAPRPVPFPERGDTIIDNDRRTWDDGMARTGEVTLFTGTHVTVEWAWPVGATTTVAMSRVRPYDSNKPLPRSGYTLCKAVKYVGVVEYATGETRGHYWLWSDAAEQALLTIVDVYNRVDVGDYRVHVTTEANLKALHRRDRNRGGPRVNLYDAPTSGWDAFVSATTPVDLVSAAPDVTPLDILKELDPFPNGRGLGAARHIVAEQPVV